MKYNEMIIIYMAENETESSTEADEDFPAWYLIPITGVGLQGVLGTSTASTFAGLMGQFVGPVIVASLFAMGWGSYIAPKSLGMSKYGWSLAALVALPAATLSAYPIAYAVVGLLFAFLSGVPQVVRQYSTAIRSK